MIVVMGRVMAPVGILRGLLPLRGPGLVIVRVLLLDALVVLEIDLVGQIDHRGAADLGDRLVERGLEARDVGDEGGVVEGVDGFEGDVVVVRLLAGGRDAGDVDVVAADGLGEVLDRVEGHRHREGALGASRGLGTGGVRGQGRAGGQGQPQCGGCGGGQDATDDGNVHGRHCRSDNDYRQTAHAS